MCIRDSVCTGAHACTKVYAFHVALHMNLVDFGILLNFVACMCRIGWQDDLYCVLLHLEYTKFLLRKFVFKDRTWQRRLNVKSEE